MTKQMLESEATWGGSQWSTLNTTTQHAVSHLGELRYLVSSAHYQTATLKGARHAEPNVPSH